jgi:hypothetical protein
MQGSASPALGIGPHLTPFSNSHLKHMAAFAALAVAAMLGGCTSSRSPSAPAAAAISGGETPTIAADQLVGSWGLASYREEKDFARTEAEAKAACSNPYAIGKGASGGIVMHLADQPQPAELVVKAAAGRNFVGPANEPPGGPKDREISSFNGSTFVAKWVDPNVATRYGTMIFTRCAAA